jgi:GxxExxY protein
MVRAVAQRNANVMSREELNIRSGHVVNASMEVHSCLGPRCLESAYLACLAYELRSRNLDVRQQVVLPVHYKGVRVELGYRLDLLVDDEVIVELKTVAKLLPVHDAQLLSYLIMSGRRVGLVINFH